MHFKNKTLLTFFCFWREEFDRKYIKLFTGTKWKEKFQINVCLLCFVPIGCFDGGACAISPCEKTHVANKLNLKSIEKERLKATEIESEIAEQSLSAKHEIDPISRCARPKILGTVGLFYFRFTNLVRLRCTK